MNHQRTDGLVFFDGRIAGPLPSAPGSRPGDSAAALQRWVQAALDAGLQFKLQIHGRDFTLTPDSAPVPVKALAGEPAQAAAALLHELLKSFSADELRTLKSTLRSLEHRAGQTFQTLYLIGADGRVELQQNIAAADSADAAPSPFRRRAKVAFVTLLALAVLIGATTPFLDYRPLLMHVRHILVPVQAKSITVDDSQFRNYFTAQPKEMALWGDKVVLTFTLVAAPPDAPSRAGTAETIQEVKDRLLREAFVRGFIRAEFFNSAGDYIGFDSIRITELTAQANARWTPGRSLDVAVPAVWTPPLGKRQRIWRIVLSP